MTRNFVQDLRYGARMLLKKPGFTLIAVITLALGIGASTAIFSFVNAMLVNPLSFPELDRMVAVWETQPNSGNDRLEATIANYIDWRNESQSFEDLGLYRWWSTNLTGVDTPERVQGYLVTANLLDVTGVKPMLGRGFRPEEDQPGKDAVVILLHGLWQRRFGGDPNIIGQTIALNGITRTVIGVMPPDYIFPKGAEVLAPLAITPEMATNRGHHAFLAVARLKPGASIEQAQADLGAIAKRLEQQYPVTNTGHGVAVYPLLDDTVRLYSAALLASLGAVGFVLMIACANIASLMLARAAGRTREMAIRAALGASRWRIIRQLLTESVLLAVIGGAAGLLIAYWGIDTLKAALPGEAQQFAPGFQKIGLNLAALGFTLALSLLTGTLFGLAPALQVSRPDLSEALKVGGKSSGAARHRLRSLLVISEVALSLVLLIGAGLMIKSFTRIIKVNPGFNPASVLTMSITLPNAKYNDEAKRAAFYQELVGRVKELSGLESVGVVNHLPLGGSNSGMSFLAEGVPDPPPGQDFRGRYRVCTPDYFSAMGITLIKGRGFTEQDKAGAPRVIIVNETLARKFWGDGDWIGKHIRFSGAIDRNPWMEVVGVAGDVKYSLDLPVTTDFYVPHAQDPWGSMVLAARTEVEPLAMASVIRQQVQAIDKDQPVFNILSMEQVRDGSIAGYRLSGLTFAIFALVALAIASIGLYGLMSYNVSQRTHEIGVRMALGAESRDVLMLVVRQGMRLTLIGLVVGLLGGLGLSRALASLLFGVTATDWATYGIVSLLLAVVALAACYIPARRATKVDPMVALRHE